MEYIDIVFDTSPKNNDYAFIEVEDPQGRSISIGEWIRRDDGYWVLRIKADAIKEKGENRSPPQATGATDTGTRVLSGDVTPSS